MTEKQMNCVCVIQARRGSSRLPDKILKVVAGKPMLTRVIERCQMIEGVDKVICAVPEGSYNDPVEELALSVGADVVRGSEQDVLSRYVAAAGDLDCRYVMRVTSDCPLLDPAVCAELLQGVRGKGVRYGATAWWPHGLDCEVFEKGLLLEADDNAQHPYEREHVTLWMKTECKGADFVLSPGINYSETYRWVLDYPEDLAFLEKLIVLLPPECTDWREVKAVVDANPELLSVNKAKIEEWRHKTNAIYRAVAEES